MDADCAGDGLEIGATITQAVEDAFGEAAARLPEMERLYVMGLIDRVRRGELGIYTLLDGAEVAGSVCYRSVDGEAELAFGFLRPPYAGEERAFLGKVVGRMAEAGINVVRSGFTWPDAERFIAAIVSMGFLSVRRISMAKDVDDHHLSSYVPAPGINVLTWSPWYFEEACRIMYEESVQADRELYPLFASPEGSRKLLLSIVQDLHGTFMPGLSAVCQVGGAIAGFMLCSMLADGSVLVLDIAVRKAYRRRGAGTKMIEYLISKCAALGKRQVVLAVTADNEAAIGLYKKMGFREVATFDQHILTM